jgi:thiamine biosynthesis lipoprotein
VTRLLPAALLLLVPVVRADAAIEVHYVMGTFFTITAEGEDAREAMGRCFAEARRLETVFTRFDPASELSRVNADAGAPRRVSADLGRLLEVSRRLTVATDGAFDVTVGPLAALWRRPEPPDAAELAAARALVGRARLRHDVLTLAPGARLDFDGIAKGYAVDACVDRLRAAGIRRALVSLGESSLYALGAPAGRSHWTLAVRGARPDEIVGELRLRDQAASLSATFGDAPVGARRPGRIVDPRTGRALAQEALAVVVASSATAAEAYSKALLLWGADGGARTERAGALAAVHVAAGRARPGPGARRTRVFAPYASPRPLATEEPAA